MAVHATAAFSCCATGVLLRCGEFQLIAVLHDIYGLPRKDADMAKASSFPNVAIFEKMFFNEVLGGTLEDDANGKLVPLLPPTDITVATLGRLVDRFADGDITSTFSDLTRPAPNPELAEALDASSAEDVRCSRCTANVRHCSEDHELVCSRCSELREWRSQYETLLARFVSLFVWPTLMDSVDIEKPAPLYPKMIKPGPHIKKTRQKYRPKKLRKPWVTEKWKLRRQAIKMEKMGDVNCSGVNGGSNAEARSGTEDEREASAGFQELAGTPDGKMRGVADGLSSMKVHAAAGTSADAGGDTRAVPEWLKHSKVKVRIVGGTSPERQGGSVAAGTNIRDGQSTGADAGTLAGSGDVSVVVGPKRKKRKKVPDSMDAGATAGTLAHGGGDTVVVGTRRSSRRRVRTTLLEDKF